VIVEELEKLVRRYLSTGMTVVVVLIAPVTAGGTGDTGTGDPAVIAIEPGELPVPGPATAGTGALDPAAGRAGDRDGSTATGGRSEDPGTRDGTDRHRDGPGGGDRAEDRDGYGQDGTGRDDGTGGRDGYGRDGTGQDGADRVDEDRADRDEGVTAAEVHGWGTPDRVDDFTGGTEQWDIYDGPGHAGQGIRSPDAVSVADGILTITGDSAGTTAGMAWNPGQKYGRWEGRVRAPASDPSYNALLLLWPDAENFPVGGEIDFMEMLDHTRQTTSMFLHYGPNNDQLHGEVQIDGTRWNNWAVEWTPTHIAAFVNGDEWWRTERTDTFPPGPMHLCIQLDWFPDGGTPQESVMHVDWVRQYSLDGGSAGGDVRDSPGDDDPDTREGGLREDDRSDPGLRDGEAGDGRSGDELDGRAGPSAQGDRGADVTGTGDRSDVGAGAEGMPRGVPERESQPESQPESWWSGSEPGTGSGSGPGSPAGFEGPVRGLIRRVAGVW
jgi:hypothetical protein